MVALAAAGCSGSEADSSNDADSATQFFLDFAAVAGVELDLSCVQEAVETLSPEDTRTLPGARVSDLGVFQATIEQVIAAAR